MPFQNRVTPLGELIATPDRGLVYGNRGRLHDEDGSIRRPWQVKRWISCRLEFRGRYRPGGPMAPNRYTGLFFLDEATALAAGHRPCAECRNADYRSFLALTGASGADELDERLHVERGRLHAAELKELPDGAFVALDGEPWLVAGSELLRWTPGGYSERRPRFSGGVDAITPPTSLHVLDSDWRGSVPFVHPG
ncbi:MAG: hypothetical protein WAL31_11710 [Gaiellaceae bacterium]